MAQVKVELVFDPFDLSDIDVRYQGRPMGKAIPRRIRSHTHPKAKPETAPPPKSSGIDYLGLVASRVAAEQARRIAYAEIASVPDNNHNDNAKNDDDNDKETEL